LKNQVIGQITRLYRFYKDVCIREHLQLFEIAIRFCSVINRNYDFNTDFVRIQWSCCSGDVDEDGCALGRHEKAT